MSELVRMAAARLRAQGVDAKTAETLAPLMIGPAALRRERQIDAMTPEELRRLDKATMDQWAWGDATEDSR